jgi:hypothetical protein
VREDEPDGGALELAFAYLIWPEQRLLRASLALVDLLLNAHSWVWHKGYKIDLRSCMVTSCLALIYDTLYDALTPIQRHAITHSLLERDLGIYQGIASSQSEGWTNSRMNWQSVVHSHIGIAALAMGDELPNWREILRLATLGVIDFLDAQPEDGSYPEGLLYWHFGIGEAAWFAYLLKLASRDQVTLLAHPYFAATGKFAYHMSTPDGCFDFEDCCSFRADDWLAALLARECNDRVLGSIVVPFDIHNPPFRKINVPARVIRHILPDVEGLPSEPPEDYPTSHYFRGTETVCMRSDWRPNATYVAFHAGRTALPHSHSDVGSFIVGSRGRRLIPDAGFWPYAPGYFQYDSIRWDFDGAAATGHSILLIDSAGPLWGNDCDGRFLSVTLGPGADSVACDLTSAYKNRVASYVRYFIFLHPDLILILDDVKGLQPRYYKWLIQTSGSVELGEERCRIRNEDATATIQFYNLSKERGYRMTSETRISHYGSFVDDHQAPPSVEYVSVGALHREANWLVGAAIFIGDSGASPSGTALFSGSPASVRWVCSVGEVATEVTINRVSKVIAVGPYAGSATS